MMNYIGDAANVFTVISGVVFVVSVFWKIVRWSKLKIQSFRAMEKELSELAKLLVDNATNPARRADIYSYIQIRCALMEGNFTRIVVLVFGTFILTVMLSGYTLILFKGVALALWIQLLIVFLAFGLFANSVGLFYMLVVLNRTHKAWVKTSLRQLASRAHSHVSDSGDKENRAL